ncbi:hypothetical protein CVU37_06685 [candidate division BRC1 bacterium HGW-BRC1-1]|jgi:peroxiredoxin|nr:MAG: hypothetical protein CVU37_06685 [candidate division BRC1 bacterium HGW-BRC1-1]
MKTLSFGASISLAILLVALLSPKNLWAQAADSGRSSKGYDVPTTSTAVKPLKEGDKVPSVEVFTAEGNAVNLSDLISSAPTVLIFYRGGWCPYCNVQLGKLATIEGQLAAAGYQVIAISPDAPEHLRETATKNKTNYLLLSDSSAKAIKAFGLAFRVDDGTVERYRAFKNPVDLEQRAGGQSHHILPVPAAYVIDTSGKIRYAYWDPDYKTRVNEQELLEAARRLK